MVKIKDRQMLQDAWKIGTGGGGGKPYYALEVDGMNLDGERNWNDRWNLVRHIPFAGKSVLELGCNVGLFSIYALEECGARSADGVDLPDDVLTVNGNPLMAKAARMVNAAFGSRVTYHQVNLNAQPYEEILGTGYDVVFCMSFFKWVDDKDRFLRYLSHFDEIVYEGHESDEVEISRFSRYGFESQILGRTQIGRSYGPDDCRTIIYIQKKCASTE